jgi:putative GTP pyrophosphokinase
MAEPTGGKTRKKNLTKAGEWYDARLDIHGRLAWKVKSILEELLHAKRIQFDRVDARVKTRKSFLKKADKKVGVRRKYSAPTEQILDVVGVRVITYLDSTVGEVSALIESEFETDPTNSLDKREALGTDRVGYRSKHYVAKLGRKRADLAECVEFKDIPFEIQIRSLLQHAWSELEHDRRFKYPGELPDDIKRRFSLLAAQLESVDREFNNVAREIDERAARTARSASGPDASEPLTVVNATEYLRGVLAKYIPSGLVEQGLGGGGAKELMDELTRFGVTTLGGLAELLPPEFTSRHPEMVENQTTFIGLLRNAMILRDAERYFGSVWQKHRRQAMLQSDIDIFTKYGVDIAPLLKKHGILSDEELAEEEYTDMCVICGRVFPQVDLRAIGAGDQEAPFACRECVEEMRPDHASEDD